jgi:hypothetical protein
MFYASMRFFFLFFPHPHKLSINTSAQLPMYGEVCKGKEQPFFTFFFSSYFKGEKSSFGCENEKDAMTF